MLTFFKLLRRGPMTSEFWLTLLALVLPYVADLSSDTVHAWADGKGWIGVLAVAVYTLARGYVKGQAVKHGAEAALGLELEERDRGSSSSSGSTPPRPEDLSRGAREPWSASP